MIKIFIPSDSKITTNDSEKWKNTLFTFQREGSETIEKGTVGTFLKTPQDPSPERDAIENAAKTGTALEVEIVGEMNGVQKMKIPRKGAGGGGGGGGGKPGGYRGKPMGDKEFFAVYGRVKRSIDKVNADMYPEMTQAERAELTRGETAQIIIMIQQNVYQPPEAK